MGVEMKIAANYLQEIKRRLSDATLLAQCEPAVEAICESVGNDCLCYVFGTGHSHMLAEELHFRAGGPAFVVPILDPAVMLHEGAVRSTLRERETGIAATIMKRYPIGTGDVFIVISNSGVNNAPVEALRIAQQCGAKTIALTSVAYSASISDGRECLAGLAEIVLDNGLPPGDALIEIRDSSLSAGAGSTVIGAALLNAIFSEVADRLAADGRPPVYRSANMPGAKEFNAGLIEKYRSRNRHL